MDIHISRHAQQRYILRVDAAVRRPDLILRTMWVNGREATRDDFSTWRVRPEQDGKYRVAKAPNGLCYLLAARNTTVVTLFDWGHTWIGVKRK